MKLNPDYTDAIALIDLIDNDDAKDAVLAALTTSFKPKEKRKLWAMLTPAQKQLLTAQSF